MRQLLEDILLQVSKSEDIDSGDLAAATETILCAVRDGLGLARASIWVLSSDAAAITCRLLLDINEAERNSGLIITQADYPNYFAALLKERVIVAHDVQSNEATADFYDSYCQPLGISSMLDSPLRHKGKMIGILCCEHVGPMRQWQTDEITFASAMADLYGRAVSAAERLRYEEELRRQNERLEEIVAERTESLQSALQNFQQAQERLIETEKMAALGKLVAGVAHEVNTPLGIAVTAITHCEHRLQQLQKQIDAGQLSKRAMNEFIDESDQAYRLLSSNLERATVLIQNFKRTAVDQSSFELVDCEIKAYLEALMFSLRPLLKKKTATVDIDCDESVSVRTYQGAIAQIVTNLVGNSCSHGFTDAHEDNHIRIQVIRSERGIELDFADNGVGMAGDVRKQVFDPFYTTARHSGGSGLGLYIVYNLVTQKLKGSIRVSTAPKQGARFQLVIPDLVN